MPLNYSPDAILHEPHLSLVEQQAQFFILEIALLGLIPLALDLQSTLNSHGHLVIHMIPLDHELISAWDLIGKYPSYPFDPLDETKKDELRQRQKELYGEQWGGVPERSRKYDEEGLEACRTGEKVGPRIYADEGQRLIKALEISLRINSPGLLQGKGGDSRLRVKELDGTSAEILGRIVGKWDEYNLKTHLARAGPLWGLYARGILADALGLTEEEVTRKGKEIAAAFEKRLESGFAETKLAGSTIQELLGIGNRISVEVWRMMPEMHRPVNVEGLYKSPAGVDEISQMERRLGVELPEDYKEFLSKSNGFSNQISGSELGIYNGYFHGPALYDASRVEWISESWLQQPVDLLDVYHILSQLSSEKQQSELGEWDTPLPLFDRVLEIGSMDIHYVWLIPPNLVQRAVEVYERLHAIADDGRKRAINRAVESFAGSWEEFRRLEWCCARWTAGGGADLRIFKSFTQYLEDTVDRSVERRVKNAV